MARARVRTTVDFDPALFERLIRVAEKLGVARNQLIAEALEARLAEEEMAMKPIYLVRVPAHTEAEAAREYSEADFATIDYGDCTLGFRRLGDALAAAERYGGRVAEGWLVRGFDASHPAADEVQWVAFDGGMAGVEWPHTDAESLRALLAQKEEE